MDTFFVPQTLMSAAENDWEKLIVSCESNDRLLFIIVLVIKLM